MPNRASRHQAMRASRAAADSPGMPSGGRPWAAGAVDVARVAAGGTAATTAVDTATARAE